MAVHVDPERFKHIASRPLEGSQYLQPKEREALLEDGIKTQIQGDVYIQEGVDFKPQSEGALRAERLNKPKMQLGKNELFVAFRNPDNDKETLVIVMDKETLNELQSQFSKKDFFEREDGIVRLNGESERYVAGWLKEINHNRGYVKADTNKDGLIDENEEKSLNIGFDRKSVYEYLGEDVTSVGTSLQGRKYQAYGDTFNANNSVDIVTTQALKFKSSAYAELLHTIKMDDNKDGKVTLEEGLKEFVPKNKETHEYLAQKIRQAHLEWIHLKDPVLEPNRLAYRDISMPEILSKEEREKELQKMIMQHG